MLMKIFHLQACGDRVLRGVHEWEQHKHGRGHRKRISRLRKVSTILLTGAATATATTTTSTSWL